LPLYKLQTDQNVSQIKPASFASERELQCLFEANLTQLLGVRFVGSEFTNGDRQLGLAGLRPVFESLSQDWERGWGEGEATSASTC
jgi:hypothetical protein